MKKARNKKYRPRPVAQAGGLIALDRCIARQGSQREDRQLPPGR